MNLVAGIFVGGRASRMAGVAKGLLVAPDGTSIVPRTARLLADIGIPCVLVGQHPAYAALGLEMLADHAGAEGPLAGLLALLAHAGERQALAFACDMPLLTRELVERLVDAPLAPIVAPRRTVVKEGALREVWEPLFARHDAARVLPIVRTFAAGGGRRLQALFDVAGARALPLDASEAALLADWDEPSDLPPGASRGTRAS